MSERLTVKQIKEILSKMELFDACKYLEELKLENASIDKLKESYNKKKIAYTKEIERINSLNSYENRAYLEGKSFVGGIDEAGRGPLAGPVVAACVVLPQNTIIQKIDDSKKLSSKVRDELYDIIKEKAISYGIGIVGPEDIDDINILNATKKAMSLAIEGLGVTPDLLLIDAVSIENISIPQIPIIKGDSLSISIAAASILAKVTRDRIIEEFSEIYPQYLFSKNKGYGTKEHIEAIKKYGLSPIHRRSFTKNFI